MQTTLLNEILSLILGRKYYAIAVREIGINRIVILDRIYTSKEDVNKKIKDLESVASFTYFTTISFRSRKQLC